MIEYPIYKLKDVSMIIAGQSPESKYYNTVGDGLPFFQGKADFGDLYPTIRTYCSQPTKIAEKDDILLSVRAPVGPTNLSPGKVCIGRGLSAIRPSEKLDLRYLLYYFRQYEAYLREKGTGTTFKAITQDILKNLEIPVPPLTEQKRIVARIEELFSELDAAEKDLNLVKKKLLQYRRAVVKEALTPALHPEIQWTETVIENVCDCLDSRRKPVKKSERSSGSGIYPYYGANGITGMIDDYLFDEELVLVVEDETFVGRVKPFSYIIRGKSWVNNHAHILRGKDGIITNEYLNYLLSYYPFLPLTTGTTGRKKLTKKALMNAPIHVAEYKHQSTIVSEIESRLSVCDKIEETVNTALQEAEAMRQSILKQAFAGEL